MANKYDEVDQSRNKPQRKGVEQSEPVNNADTNVTHADEAPRNIEERGTYMYSDGHQSGTHTPNPAERSKVDNSAMVTAQQAPTTINSADANGNVVAPKNAVQTTANERPQETSQKSEPTSAQPTTTEQNQSTTQNSPADTTQWPSYEIKDEPTPQVQTEANDTLAELGLDENGEQVNPIIKDPQLEAQRLQAQRRADEEQRQREAEDRSKITYIDPKTGKQKRGSYVEMLADYDDRPSAEERAKEAKRAKRRAIIAALGDGISAFSNLVFTNKGAPDQGLRPNLSEAEQGRYNKMLAAWQQADDDWKKKMVEAGKMDYQRMKDAVADRRAQAKEDRDADKYEYEKSRRPKEEALFDARLQAILHDNSIDDATKDDEIAALKAKYQGIKADGEFRAANNGASRAQVLSNNETTRHHRVTESHSGRGGSGSSGKKGNELITPNGTLNPSNAQVRQAYSFLANRNFVSGKANSIAGMLTEIQDYYDGGGRNYTVGTTYDKYDVKHQSPKKVHNPVTVGYEDDKNGGAKVDSLLGYSGTLEKHGTHGNLIE